MEQVEDISMKSTSILQKDVGKSGILEGTNVCVEGSSKPYIYSLLKIWYKNIIDLKEGNVCDRVVECRSYYVPINLFF